MCVILVAETRRLSDHLIDLAIDANRDGNGLAWRNGNTVAFRKGLTRTEAKALARTLPLPYVFHARIATIGKVCAGLCHPFPMDLRLDANASAGRSRKGVLFHNGHWDGWREYVEDTSRGAWSDSRGMATIAGRHGIDVLEQVVPDSQRVVVFTPTRLDVLGFGWTTLKPGIRASNRLFERYSAPTRHAPQTRLLSDGELADLRRRYAFA